MTKESFLIYKSFYEPVKELPNEDLGELFRALFEYQINGIEPTNTNRIYMAFQFFKNQFRLDEIKYEKIVNRNKLNGSKGGRPETQNNPNNPVGFKEPKKTDNDNDNDNEKDNDNENILLKKVTKENILKRKLEFKEKVNPFLEKYGKDILNEFFKYWTEPNKKNTKMRFESEEYFDVGRRLSTWQKNNQKFNSMQDVNRSSSNPEALKEFFNQPIIETKQLS